MPSKRRHPEDADRELNYDEFRTGLTFGEVRKMLWVQSTDPKDWRYKRRGTVLGMWRQIKQEMYAEYLRRRDECSHKNQSQDAENITRECDATF